MLSNNLRFNFRFLKIIYILRPRYHLKIIRYIIKIAKEQVCLYLRDYMINHNENEDGHEK